MPKFYVVTFSSQPCSYKVRSVHTDEAEAVQALLSTPLVSRGAVLRHGATGKRESVADANCRMREAA